MSVWWRIGLAVIALMVLLPALQLYAVTHPAQISSGRTPTDLGLAYEEVRFETEDGVTLAGWFIPAATPSKVAVLAGHGYPAEKGDVLGLVRFLHEDHHLFLFDHRSFGESERSMTTVGLREPLDVVAALDHLASREEVEHVVGFGLSLSAATMLMAQDDRLEALVADAGFARLDLLIGDLYPWLPGPTKLPMVWTTELYARAWLGTWPSQVSPEAAIQEAPFPVLIIHGTEDGLIPVEHAHRLHERAGPQGSELFLVEGAGHAGTYGADPASYEQRVRTFLAAHPP
ncbi:MAG: alpha/beta hydrolase [Candidatus Thermoplasmatota archaeon]|nr:alpha/beta hydrolase [Candidatus Thermoplasmatota archaeon]